MYIIQFHISIPAGCYDIYIYVEQTAIDNLLSMDQDFPHRNTPRTFLFIQLNSFFSNFIQTSNGIPNGKICIHHYSSLKELARPCFKCFSRMLLLGHSSFPGHYLKIVCCFLFQKKCCLFDLFLYLDILCFCLF